MRRWSPWRLVVAVGVVAAVVFAASGIAPTITQWHDDSPVTRPVFIDVPSALKVTFYTAIVLLALALGWLWAVRVRNWQRGQPEDRTTTKLRHMFTHRSTSTYGKPTGTTTPVVVMSPRRQVREPRS